MTMTGDEIAALGIVEVRDAIALGRLSSEEATAACLATKVSGELDHPGIHAVSDPDFMSRIA